MIPCNISNTTITVIAGAKPFSLDRTDKRADRLIQAVRDNSEQAVLEILDEHRKELESTIQSLEICDVKVEIRFGHVYVDGKLDNGDAAKQILNLHTLGLPTKHLMAFIARLKKNPSFASKRDLFAFLERNKMPITEDGYVIAFKVVRADYMDIHSGTFRNAVGDRPRMARNEVDDDNQRDCSAGLHVCGEEYIPSFGTSRRGTDRVMLVRIDPADFVAVPQYDGRKARVSTYEVISEMSREDAAGYLKNRITFNYDEHEIDVWNEHDGEGRPDGLDDDELVVVQLCEEEDENPSEVTRRADELNWFWDLNRPIVGDILRWKHAE